MVLLLAAARAGAPAAREILADPATISSGPGRSRAPGSASRRCSARATRTSRPPATTRRREPLPARAARLNPRRGHRAERRQRRARLWLQGRPSGRRSCGSSGSRARAARWRARSVLGEHDVTLRDVATLAGVRGRGRRRVEHPRTRTRSLRAAIKESNMPAVERSRAREQAALMLAADAVGLGGPPAGQRSGPRGTGHAPPCRPARRGARTRPPRLRLERAAAEAPGSRQSCARSSSSWAWRAAVGHPDAAEYLQRAAEASSPDPAAAQRCARLVAGRASKAADIEGRQRARGGRGREAAPRR